MAKKILITGATGFIGRNIIKYIIKKKLHLIYEIHIFIRKEEHKLLPIFKEYNFFFYVTDIYSRKVNDGLFYKLNNIDFLIHLAWGGLPNYNSSSHTYEFMKQKKFFNKILSHKIKNIIVTGTCFEYGKLNGELKEDATPKEITKYGKAKYKLLNFLIQKTKNTNIKFNWLRVFYIYGKDQNKSSLYPQLLQSIKKNKKKFNLSPGDQKRDFIHISSFLKVIDIIINKNKNLKVINICSGKPISVKKFTLNIIKRHKSKIILNTGYYDYPTYEPMHFWGNNRKLKKLKNEK